MPSPESSRRNLDKARLLGRVIFWRSRSESQRVKAEIVWLHETKPELSQRVIARTFHVSQPYVARMLKRVRLLGVEKALGLEASKLYGEYVDSRRRENYDDLVSRWSSPRPQPEGKVEASESTEVKYVELIHTRDGQIVQGHDSKPTYALTDSELQQFRQTRPAPAVPAPQSWVTQFSAKEIAGLYVADQCPSFGRR